MLDTAIVTTMTRDVVHIENFSVHVDESDFVPFFNNNSSSSNNTSGMMLLMNNVSQISSATPSLAQHPSFLVYHTHSGFSNQLMGLQRAAQLAYATGRILVLPPVLPHNTKEVQRYPSWKSQSGGASCEAYQRTNLFQRQAQRDALIASQLQNWSNFPSYHGIINFTNLTHQTGLQVIDLDEFMKRQKKRGSASSKELFRFLTNSHNTSTSTWCNGNIKRKVYPSKNPEKKCELEPTVPYEELVRRFQKEISSQHERVETIQGQDYVKDCTVANIGSAFILRNDFDYPNKDIFDTFFANYPLVSPWNEILQTLLANIPHQEFWGAHVRTEDNKVECDLASTLYQNAARQLVKWNQESDLNPSISTSKTNSSASLVVVGRTNRNSQKCLQQALQQEMSDRNVTLVPPTVMTVGDLIDSNPQREQLNQWIQSIPMEISTTYLLLDQFTLSLARHVTMTSVFGSTFQALIENRHGFRNENLANLGF